MFAECTHILMTNYGLITSLFLAGLVGSFTHCAGMCTPFVLAQSENGPLLQKPLNSLLLPYHLGRMTTYVGMGAVMHSIVNMAYLFSHEKALITAPLLMLAGVMFLVTVFPSWSSVFPWISKIRFPVALSFMSAKASRLFYRQDFLARYILGILLGFMPCGLVIAALMASATAHSLPQAVMAMTAFSIGTMPALMAIGLCGKGLKQKFPQFAKRFSQTAMVISSLWLFALAGMMIF